MCERKVCEVGCACGVVCWVGVSVCAFVREAGEVSFLSHFIQVTLADILRNSNTMMAKHF